MIDFTFTDVFNPNMRIETLEEPGLVRWRCVGGHEPWADNEFRFDLEEHDVGTRLTFRQDYARELEDVYYGIYNFNWAYYLESLRMYCQSGTGKPFEP